MWILRGDKKKKKRASHDNKHVTIDHMCRSKRKRTLLVTQWKGDFGFRETPYTLLKGCKHMRKRPFDFYIYLIIESPLKWPDNNKKTIIKIQKKPLDASLIFFAFNDILVVSICSWN